MTWDEYTPTIPTIVSPSPPPARYTPITLPPEESSFYQNSGHPTRKIFESFYPPPSPYINSYAPSSTYTSSTPLQARYSHISLPPEESFFYQDFGYRSRTLESFDFASPSPTDPQPHPIPNTPSIAHPHMPALLPKNSLPFHHPNDTRSRKLGAGALVGIILGVVAVIVGISAIVVILIKRRRLISNKGLENQSDTGQQLQSPTDHSFASPLRNGQQSASYPTRPHLLAHPRVPPLLPSTSSSLGSDKPFSPPSPRTFSYEELKVATNNFSYPNIIGQGGFGNVYKGVLPNGEVVAIKKRKADSGQGEREFRSEVQIITRIHHRHLVSLVGYCISGAQRLLVYEFVPNNTLQFHLHGKGRPAMEWPARMKVAIGSAKGLAYLHEDCQPKIIHRDIKASNILVDDNFDAKVADFGLAKYFDTTESHVSTRIVGTLGYMAPEYANSGNLTEKTDIYSFGVLLLELITGRLPLNLADWAKPLLTKALGDCNFEALVDPKLKGYYDSSEMYRMVACAASSVRQSATSRPRMSQILRALEGNMSLNDLNDGITGEDITIYSQNLENMNMTLQNREYATSEYSGTTSEYGQYQSSSLTESKETTGDGTTESIERRYVELPIVFFIQQ